MTRIVPLSITYTEDSFLYALRYSVPVELYKQYMSATKDGPNNFVTSGKDARPILEKNGGVLNGKNAYTKSKLIAGADDTEITQKIFEADYDEKGIQIAKRHYDENGKLSHQTLINPENLSEAVCFKIESPYEINVTFPDRHPPVPGFDEFNFVKNRNMTSLQRVKDKAGNTVSEVKVSDFKNNIFPWETVVEENKTFSNLTSEVTDMFSIYDTAARKAKKLTQ